MARELGFPVFDGDSHLHETREALTACRPDVCQGAIRKADA
jgi:hypothetical protein